jgi:hypothetical protein
MWLQVLLEGIQTISVPKAVPSQGGMGKANEEERPQF